jgi:glycosyltransferase involved in cell wall biosynthesis
MDDTQLYRDERGARRRRHESTDETPLVSILVPFLNAERFIGEALASVATQTYANWELLLVDDGSTDASRAVADESTRSYQHKVKFLEHPRNAHRGMAPSRNLALREAKGSLIAQLDADDVWDPTHLKQKIEILVKYPDVAWTFGPMCVWHEWQGTDSPGKDIFQTLTVPLDRVIQAPDLLPPLLSGLNDPAGVIVRRDHAQAVDGYDESLQYCEDTTLYCKLALRYPVYISSRPTYRYRQHDNSYCRSVRATGQVSKEWRRFLMWLSHYIKIEQVRSEIVMRALTKEIWKLDHPKTFFCIRKAGEIRDLAQTIARELATLQDACC